MRIAMTLILLTTFLSGCTSNNYTLNFEQCEVRFSYTPEGFIDEESSWCACRPYQYSAGYIGSTGSKKVYSLNACNKLVGTLPSEYAKTLNFFEKIRQDYLDWLTNDKDI